MVIFHSYVNRKTEGSSPQTKRGVWFMDKNPRISYSIPWPSYPGWDSESIRNGSCLSLRQENRTCVLLLFGVLPFVLGLGWGGVGGHVNVPGTSYMIYCHVAKISGIAYYVTCCYVAEISSVGWGGVGWGGMLTFLVLRTWSIAMLLRSLGSLTTWHVVMLLRSLVWVGVGWGGGAC